MRQHLLPDPDAQPTPIEQTEAGWLRLSAAMTDQVAHLADRDDLIVHVAPGAGRGAPGCFLPTLATIELDGQLLPTDMDPALAQPRRPSDRERYPAAWGVLCHEAGHARHTQWQPPDGAPTAVAAAAKLLEESRAEARQLERRPGDRRWLRAATQQLILDDGQALDKISPWAVAEAAALVLGRVDAGVLDPDEAAPLATTIEATLGAEQLHAIRQVWQAALETADDNSEAMLALGHRWCELTGVDPDHPTSDAISPCESRGDPACQGGGNNGAGRSPIGQATRAVLAAVAANDAQQAADEARAAGAVGRRAAAKAREAASRRRAQDAATTVFAPPRTHPGATGPGAPATWTSRPPTPAERAAARRLARQLRAAAYRERATTHITSKAPPGRLRMRAALAADAQHAVGLRPTAEPWVRTIRRQVPTPPLRVGIAVDISGSMRPFAKPLASAAWIMAQAAAWSHSTSATVCFANHVTAVARPGQVPAHVREFSVGGGSQGFPQAVDALDGALGLARVGDSARLLVVVSDGRYPADQRALGQAQVRRLVAAGCGVLWIAVGSNATPLDGAQIALLDDPAAAGAVISAAARRALRASR